MPNDKPQRLSLKTAHEKERFGFPAPFTGPDFFLNVFFLYVFAVMIIPFLHYSGCNLTLALEIKKNC